MLKLEGLLARVLDVALVFAGAALASQIRFDEATQGGFYEVVIALAAAFTLALFPAFGIYASWRDRSMLGLAGQVALAWLLVQLCGVMVMFSLHRADLISRLWFTYWTATTGGLLILSRLATHLVLGHVRSAGMNLHHVAVVGSGAHCDAVIRRVASSRASGFRVAAAFNVAPGVGGLNAKVPTFEDRAAFHRYLRTQQIHELWLALPLSQEPAILDFVREYRDELINIRFMPDLRSVALFDAGMIDLIGMHAINLVASPISPNALMQKDIFDRLFAAAVLLGLAPLLLAIAVAVKLSSRGPVLFKQKRKGADGRVFTIYKFRSMRAHTEPTGVLTQATRNDPRITRVGAFLRRTSLDELPQFFNVLRGDMSVVGPRPHAIEHDDQYQKIVAGYIHRYRIKPGITGWAQVNGYRGETDRIEKMEGRIAYDLYYLSNWSFALDLRIIAATIFKGLRQSNAY
ncbi:MULTISPECIES: undecaprenyl-phosphate glucose phosphotransferase [Cupriavidus]|uniref:Undecaprenyl-phosphate glucose phosphotransferase n=1 Tax=Cupriavidus oxalaticus TaxID=96344 RepID=A0A4P7LNM5_9BURK|nr:MULTISPECIES: undecaprenyl-phosphate glucose phosphotransferase [Cupriavidus]MBF6988966.1 undecaprenyl-phosphate glucose phosphotransferase [Cupriavidus sp. IK-TO18]QBY55293.1 undecaprenyl-phosphate glucose phosphotransferase [Cupriavidus oxalaticus]TDF63130.1 undecaprenyl-phosphate glucose phosphotransferase [Cupriavidus sp. L7L]